MTQEIDLSSLFKAVTQTLAENKDSLNQADTYNHDHGDHMVEIFTVAQRAVSKKKAEPPANQLAYASKQIKSKAKSGSAGVYAEGFQNASEQFLGKSLTTDTVGTLINALMGSSKPAQQTAGASSPDLLSSLLSGLTGAQQSQPTQTQGSGDLLGSLLSGLSGSQQPSHTSYEGDDLLGSLLSGFSGNQQVSSQTPAGTDLLGSLLGGLTGQQTTQAQPSGDLLSSLLGGMQGNQQAGSSNLNLSDMLSAGLAYFAAKQQGGSNLQAIMNALGAASPLGKSEHRKQSGALIINTILKMLGK